MPQSTSGSWRHRQGARALLAFLLLALGIVPSVLPVTAEGAANPIPVLTITLNPSNQQARVTDRDQGIVQFDGTVTLDKLPVCRTVVTLRAMLDIGWDFWLDPSIMIITSTTPQSFTVVVTVPQGTPSNITGTLKMLGRFSVCGCDGLAEATAIITVAPYFNLTLGTRAPVFVADESRTFGLKIRLTNTGNVVDTFWIDNTLTVPDAQRRWVPSIDCRTVEDLGPGMSRTFVLTARPNDGEWASREDLSCLDIKVFSLNAKDYQMLVSERLVIHIYVKLDWLDLTPLDVPMMAVILWAAAICAIVVSVIRGRKRKRSLRGPLVKEVGKIGRA